MAVKGGMIINNFISDGINVVERNFHVKQFNRIYLNVALQRRLSLFSNLYQAGCLDFL
jgi:hypothetical protein